MKTVTHHAPVPPKLSSEGGSRVTLVLARITHHASRSLLLIIIRIYRLILSPILTALFTPLGFGCRFTPTCSQYALEAVQKLGPWRGSIVAARRICRCHPWGESGYDPVPQGSPPGFRNPFRGGHVYRNVPRPENQAQFRPISLREIGRNWADPKNHHVPIDMPTPKGVHESGSPPLVASSKVRAERSGRLESGAVRLRANS